MTTSGTDAAKDLARRGAREVSRRAPGGLAVRPAAVYDTVTEGLTGWQFLRTGRWIGFAALTVIFALLCGGFSLWQYDRGRGASADNALVTKNFAVSAAPLGDLLPTLGSYRAGQTWLKASMRGSWEPEHQYYLRNSVRSQQNGFDVLTAFRLESGSTFMVDRGWVPASATDTTQPASQPAPPAGTIDVVARLQPTQPKRGEGGVVNGQIVSIDLPEIAPVVGGSVYTGAYGVIVSPSSHVQGMTRIQATPPAEGVGYHYSYMIQWIFFALLGFYVFWWGARREHRRLNAEDPKVQREEERRAAREARKEFSDEDSEDEALDGFVPLGRLKGRTAALPALRRDEGGARPELEARHRELEARRRELGR